MGTWCKDAKGFTIAEAIISLCLIGILVGVVIPRYYELAHEAREAALKMGLANIRTSIRLFRMLNDRSPRSLNELMEKNVLLPSRRGPDPSAGSLFFDEKYLVAQAMDAQGRLVDAFGNPYLYDPVLGEVRSSTKGHERW